MSILALVPARSGSKGIRRKNFRELDGKPLFVYAVDCARAVGAVPVVSSDELKYGAAAIQMMCGPLVEAYALPRPPELAQDDTPMIAVVQHALEQIPGPSDQIILLLQPTQPFRTPEHLKQAIQLLQESGADSVVSVVELPKTHAPQMVWAMDNGRLKSWLNWYFVGVINNLPTRRQDAYSAYKRDGTVYAFWRRTVEQYGNIYGDDVRPLIIPPDESCEFDTEADWQAVERRWKERHG